MRCVVNDCALQLQRACNCGEQHQRALSSCCNFVYTLRNAAGCYRALPAARVAFVSISCAARSMTAPCDCRYATACACTTHSRQHTIQHSTSKGQRLFTGRAHPNHNSISYPLSAGKQLRTDSTMPPKVGGRRGCKPASHQIAVNTVFVAGRHQAPLCWL